MSGKPATAEKTGVTLLRIGTGKQEFDLPEGATLADLFRDACFVPEDQSVFVDGKPLEEVLVLRPGMIVSTAPKVVKNDAKAGEWSDRIGEFHDDPAFDAMMQVIHEEREAETERPR
jgi:hypothetical protein